MHFTYKLTKLTKLTLYNIFDMGAFIKNTPLKLQQSDRASLILKCRYYTAILTI